MEVTYREKELVLVRKGNLPDWTFVYDPEYRAYIHKTSHDNIYRLFFSDPTQNYKPFWIGLLAEKPNLWVSVEHEIKADYIDFLGSRLIFT